MTLTSSTPTWPLNRLLPSEPDIETNAGHHRRNGTNHSLAQHVHVDLAAYGWRLITFNRQAMPATDRLQPISTIITPSYASLFIRLLKASSAVPRADHVYATCFRPLLLKESLKHPRQCELTLLLSCDGTVALASVLVVMDAVEDGNDVDGAVAVDAAPPVTLTPADCLARFRGHSGSLLQRPKPPQPRHGFSAINFFNLSLAASSLWACCSVATRACRIARNFAWPCCTATRASCSTWSDPSHRRRSSPRLGNVVLRRDMGAIAPMPLPPTRLVGLVVGGPCIAPGVRHQLR